MFQSFGSSLNRSLNELLQGDGGVLVFLEKEGDNLDGPLAQCLEHLALN